MNFERFTDIAYALKPKFFDQKYHFHVSFIVQRSRILSIGVNNPKKTHPRNLGMKYRDHRGNDVSDMVGIHSELASIIRLGETDCRRYKLVNVRIDNHGQLVNSCPCEGCLNLVSQVGFREVWYTNNGNFHKL